MKTDKSDFLQLPLSLKKIIENMHFHHIGVATFNIEKELAGYEILGYTRDSDIFEDENQGIRGLFITAPGQPRLELLENLPDSKTLDVWLKNKTKMYHFAYFVDDIESAIKILKENKLRIASPLKFSSYFNSRICFLMLQNFFIIELVET